MHARADSTARLISSEVISRSSAARASRASWDSSIPFVTEMLSHMCASSISSTAPRVDSSGHRNTPGRCGDGHRFASYRIPGRRLRGDLSERAPLSASVPERDRHRASAGIASSASMPCVARAWVRQTRTTACTLNWNTRVRSALDHPWNARDGCEGSPAPRLPLQTARLLGVRRFSE